MIPEEHGNLLWDWLQVGVLGLFVLSLLTCGSWWIQNRNEDDHDK